MRFLKVFEKSNYQTIKWVRYITKAGTYSHRPAAPTPPWPRTAHSAGRLSVTAKPQSLRRSGSSGVGVKLKAKRDS